MQSPLFKAVNKTLKLQEEIGLRIESRTLPGAPVNEQQVHRRMPTKVGVVRRQRMKVVPREPGKSHGRLPLFVLPNSLLLEDEGRFYMP